MSRKISIGAALALALLMVAASIPLTMLFAQEQQNKLIPNLPALIEKFNALDEIRREVDKNFYMPISEDVVNEETVRGYIAGLGDPLSRYMNSDEYQSYTQRQRGEAPELGLVLIYSPANYGIVVDSVKDGSTAAVSGLRAGDHIVKAESGGKELFNMLEVAPDKAAEAIAAFYEATSVPADTSSITITITYKRNENFQPPVNVMLGNSVLSLSTELMSAYAPEGEDGVKNVGYIKIYHFFKNTAEQLENAIKDLSRQGAISFIFDVRGCTEGTLESVWKATDLLAYVSKDDDAMITVYYKDGTDKPYPSTANSMISYATNGIIVLIDSRTSGVAELFAHNLRAYNPTKISLVGEPTKGIGTTQEAIPLSSVGGAALLTVGTVVPYGIPKENSEDWNANGVQPNEPTEAEMNEGLIYRVSGADQQLNSAIRILAFQDSSAS